MRVQSRAARAPLRPARPLARRWRRAAAVACTSLALSTAEARATGADEAPDESWVGRYCTPLGCSGTLDSAAGNAASFGAAAAAVLLLARRRRA